MSIEYLPVGIACNLKCDYCYQDPMRDAGNITTKINWDAARKILDAHNHNFTVFGGEPLLAPIAHLEEVFRYGFEKFGRSGIQTNGTLITGEHIELFVKYKVSVGISLDGPDDLNSARRIGDDAQTLAATAKVNATVLELCRVGIVPSIITTLHKGNADSEEKLERLLSWCLGLEKAGVQHLNFHILEVEKGKESLALSEEENINAFEFLYRGLLASKMKIQPFADIRAMLSESDPNTSCIWNHCDPHTTGAVQGVTADGVQSNCGRTNKDGVNWVKADKPGYERYLILRQTPQEHNGCKGCTFFVFCKGQCPGTAIDGDWRNRTEHCKVWYHLFRLIEQELIAEHRMPLSRDCNWKREREKSLVNFWKRGMGSTSTHGDQHGDSPHGDAPHGDSHGDAPHTDSHGDSSPHVDVVESGRHHDFGVVR